MSAKEISTRPKKVTAAVVMLYLLVVIGVFRTAMTVYRHIDVRTPDFFIATKVLTYVLSLFLIYRVSKGNNWARWLVLVLLVISFPLGILPTIDALAHNPVHALLGFFQIGLYLTAMVILFHGESSVWFGAGKHTNPL